MLCLMLSTAGGASVSPPAVLHSISGSRELAPDLLVIGAAYLGRRVVWLRFLGNLNRFLSTANRSKHHIAVVERSTLWRRFSAKTKIGVNGSADRGRLSRTPPH